MKPLTDDDPPLPPLEGDDAPGPDDPEPPPGGATDDDDRRFSDMDEPAEADPQSLAELGLDLGDDEDRWTEDSEGDERAGEESLGSGGSASGEDGWTEDADEPADREWGEDLGDAGDLNEQRPSEIASDGGEEGTSEPDPVIDDSKLGPLSGRLGEDEEFADPGLDSVLTAGVTAIEDDIEGAVCRLPALAEAEIECTPLGPPGVAVSAIVAGASRPYLAAPGVLWAGAASSPGTSPSPPLADLEVTSIVVSAGEPALLLVGTLLGGAFQSADDGATFVAKNGWRQGERRGGAAVTLYAARGRRVYARTQSGGLYRTDDFGDSWTGPLGTGGVRALGVAAAEAGATELLYGLADAGLVRSDDQGASWDVLAAGAGLSGREPSIAAASDFVAVGFEDQREGLWLSTDRGRTGRHLGSLPCPTAVAFDGDRLWVGVLIEAHDRGVLLRGRSDGADFVRVLDVGRACERLGLEATGDADSAHRIAAIAVDPHHPHGMHTVYLATAAGALSVRLGT